MSCDQKEMRRENHLNTNHFFKLYIKVYFFNLVTHFLQWSIQCKMALANSSLAMVWMTPARLLLKLSWYDERPASFDPPSERGKNTAGVISGEVSQQQRCEAGVLSPPPAKVYLVFTV
jgi:hypothetical protein